MFRVTLQLSPVDDEVLVWGLLVTHGTHPGGLLLIHLDVKSGVKALQVGARQRPAWDRQAHLSQLHTNTHTHTQTHTVQVISSH